MDEHDNGYKWRRSKREGYRHGARNRRYFEQTGNDETAEVHSSGK